MKKLSFAIIFIVILFITLILFFYHLSINESSKNNILYSIPELNPDDLKIENNYFNQTLFNVFTLTILNREIFDLTSADFNNDGFMDIAVCGSYNVSKIFLLFYHGNWNFSYNMIYSQENDIMGLVSGDFDNDGDVDIIFTSGENTDINDTFTRINGTVNFLMNNGNNTFLQSLISRRSTGVIKDEEGRINPRITSADYDADGDIDLIVGDNSGKVEYYENNGKANFTSKGIIYDFGSNSWGLTSNDFDNDNDVDFVISAHEKDNISIGHLFFKKNQYNESNGTTLFLPDLGEIIANISFIPGVGTISSFDYENDGDTDIILSTSMLMYILLNDNFTFSSVPLGSDIEYGVRHRTGIAYADFNSDGFMDFAVGVGNGIVRLFINKNSL